MELAKTAYEYSRGSINNLKKNWKSLILLLLFAFGILLGTYILKHNGELMDTIIANAFNDYIEAKKDKSIAANFIDSIKINLIFIIISFVLGFCAIGTPLISLIPVVKGIGIGVICGYLYLKYNFSGLGYCVLIIYPGLIVSMMSLLMACNFSLSFSYDMLLSVIENNKKELKGEYKLKLFCIRYLIITAISIFGSVVDSFAIKLFSGLFSF